MKSIQECPQGEKLRSFCEGAWQLFILSLLAFTLVFFATEVKAAKISFEPGELTVNVAPGDMVSVPVSVSLEDTSLSNSYASFGLSQVGGSLDRTWLNSKLYISLNYVYKTRQFLLRFQVPPTAEGGIYTGILRTAWLKSNETVEPVDLKINVKVNSLVSCSQVPLFSDISASQDAISARNNKEVPIELSGSVSAPDGCDISGASYVLTDEYGELDRTENLQINADGSFLVAVPMVASRKGNDKDGRLYTVKFLAENEAGIGESVETNIVVTHDNSEK